MQGLRRTGIDERAAFSDSPDGASISPRGPSRAPVAGNDGGGQFNDHLVGSILATIFCCLPLGIPAIVFAADARTKYAAGDYDRARNSANTANTFLWIAFWLGLGLGLIYLVVYAIIFAVAIGSH